MKEWMRRKLGVEVKVKSTYEYVIANKRLVVESLENWKKRKIMQNKIKLRQKQDEIYIEDDLTKQKGRCKRN